MLKKIGFFLILLLLLSFAVDATGNIYQKHNISFQIPSNWNVAKDIKMGMTPKWFFQITLLQSE